MDDPGEEVLGPELERRWSTIRAKMESHAEELLTSGAIVSKLARGRRVWVLRFIRRREGVRTLKTVYIGDAPPALLRRVGRLLEEYRALGQLPGQIDACARLVARASSVATRMAVETRRGRAR